MKVYSKCAYTRMCRRNCKKVRLTKLTWITWCITVATLFIKAVNLWALSLGVVSGLKCVDARYLAAIYKAYVGDKLNCTWLGSKFEMAAAKNASSPKV